jgi:predicted transcriptional regulator YheO
MKPEKEMLFDNLARVADALADQFAPYCEVVIHDLAHPDSSIVHIAGDITGRHIGGPMTDFVLGLLGQEERPEDRVGYIAHARDGKTIKSSTIFVRDESGEPVGVFCVNFDLTTLLAAGHELSQFAQASTSLEVDKSFSADVPNLQQEMIQKSIRRVLNCNHISELNGGIDKEDRRKVIADLEAQGAFRIRKATPIVAELFEVSRYTIYKDRNAVEEE